MRSRRDASGRKPLGPCEVEKLKRFLTMTFDAFNARMDRLIDRLDRMVEQSDRMVEQTQRLAAELSRSGVEPRSSGEARPAAGGPPRLQLVVEADACPRGEASEDAASGSKR